jgi:hypothetical protein
MSKLPRRNFTISQEIFQIAVYAAKTHKKFHREIKTPDCNGGGRSDFAGIGRIPAGAHLPIANIQ